MNPSGAVGPAQWAYARRGDLQAPRAAAWFTDFHWPLKSNFAASLAQFVFSESLPLAVRDKESALGTRAMLWTPNGDNPRCDSYIPEYLETLQAGLTYYICTKR